MTQSQSAVPKTRVPGRVWVRSFLFAVKIDSPLAHLHVLTKLLSILALSLLIVRFIRTDAPDPLGAVLVLALAFQGLYLGGVLRWVFRSYLLVIFPALLGMALTWIIFNADPGRAVLLRFPLYTGRLSLGISLGLVLFVLFALAWYLVRRGLFWGLVGGWLLATLLTHVLGNPSWTFATVSLFHPLEVVVSWKNLTIALTKALGYGAMIFVSLLLLMTTRDVEVTGFMRQMRINEAITFFISTMLRSLSLALGDYRTIRQAQIARGVALKKKNVFILISDLAYMAVPLTATMLRRASEVGDAALLRGFTLQTRNPTEFHEVRPFGLVDWLVLGLCVLFLLLVWILDLNLTHLLGVYP